VQGGRGGRGRGIPEPEQVPSVSCFSMTSGSQNISDNIQQLHEFVKLVFQVEKLC